MHSSEITETKTEGFKIFEKFRKEGMFSQSLTNTNSDSSQSSVIELGPCLANSSHLNKFNLYVKTSDNFSKDSVKFNSVSTAPTTAHGSTIIKSELTKENVSGTKTRKLS